MNATVFTQQLKVMSDRLTQLYQQINTSSSLPPLLSSMTELGVVSERLQIAGEMLYQHNQKLSLANQSVEAECQRYQELLDFIPDAYLLTDTSGRIKEANFAAASLLNLPQSVLIGRLLKGFISYETRQQFQTKLHQLQQKPSKQKWQLKLQPYKEETLNVNVFVVSQQQATQPLTLRWLLRLSDRNFFEKEQSKSNGDFGSPLQSYLFKQIIT